jgi:DNA-binding CsgD family transcriptional regulator
VGGHLPQLDRNALRRLRETVKAMRGAPRHSLPMRRLLEFAATAPVGAGITIDFEASQELGDALIVVRVPTPPDGQAADPRLALLSRRERDVANLIAIGLSNKQIADRLCIATSTVKDHVHHIFQKTGLANRATIAAACRGPLQDS